MFCSGFELLTTKVVQLRVISSTEAGEKPSYAEVAKKYFKKLSALKLIYCGHARLGKGMSVIQYCA